MDPVIPGFDFEAFAKPFKRHQEAEDIRSDFIRDVNSSASYSSCSTSQDDITGKSVVNNDSVKPTLEQHSVMSTSSTVSSSHNSLSSLHPALTENHEEQRYACDAEQSDAF